VVPERLRAGLAAIVGAGALCALVLFCALSPIWEMDVFWHLSVGRWILDHHALPSQNVWSAADPTQAWHPAQWLWEALAAGLDRWRGLEAVRIANAAWLTATFAVMFLLLRRRLGAAAALCAAVLVFAAFHDRVRVRPHVINLTGEILVTWFVLTVRRPRPVHLALGFAGFCLWASLHSGGAWMVVALLAVLGAFALAWERKREDRGRVMLLAFALCAGLGWLASPGSTAWISGHEDAAIGYVEEWRAWPAIVHGYGAAKAPHLVLARMFLPAAVIGWLLFFVRWRRAVRDEAVRTELGVPAELCWALLCILAGTSGWRFFYLAAIAGVALWLGWRRVTDAEGDRAPPSRRASLIAVAVTVAVALSTLQYECVDYPTLAEAWGSRGETVDDRYFPTLGTQLLVESKLQARVGVLPNWGGYVTYQGWPKLTATIDGRFCAPDEVKEITRRVLEIYDSGQHTEQLAALFDRLPADFLLLPRGRHTSRLNLPSWAKVATGAVEDLWIRKTPDSVEWIHTLRTVVERHRLSVVPNHNFQMAPH
jgi:hypothetical protein